MAVMFRLPVRDCTVFLLYDSSLHNATIGTRPFNAQLNIHYYDNPYIDYNDHPILIELYDSYVSSITLCQSYPTSSE